MNVFEMSKKDFNNIPHRKWNEDIGKFSSLVIIPTNETHDSGYMCMDFCAVDDNGRPIKLLSGGSDVIHIDGIGGFGDWRPGSGVPISVRPVGWSIDCLPCGYLRLFCHRPMTCGDALSSFEVFSGREAVEKHD